jgi:hypothetical protein
VVPKNNATSISRTPLIAFTLSEDIQAGANFAAITFKKSSTSVPYSATVSGKTLTIVPLVTLAAKSTYKVTVQA